MSFTPFGFGPRRSCPLDPFFVDYSDPSFPRFDFGDDSAFAAVADARVDWRVTHEAAVFKADLPGRHKRGVKVEAGGSSVQIRGARACKREKKTDTRNRVERVKKTGTQHRVEREKKIETWHRVESEKKTETWHRVEREKKTETWHCVEREKKTETCHCVEREKKIETCHRVEREKKTDARHRVARGKKTDSSEVLRRFRLPANVKVNQVKVAMENRTLTVTVPKKGVKKPVKKPSGGSIKIYG